jgi:hypothetical protein
LRTFVQQRWENNDSEWNRSQVDAVTAKDASDVKLEQFGLCRWKFKNCWQTRLLNKSERILVKIFWKCEGRDWNENSCAMSAESWHGRFESRMCLKNGSHYIDSWALSVPKDTFSNSSISSEGHRIGYLTYLTFVLLFSP